MDDEVISKYRSEVIERTINVEWIMNIIISQHYLKRVVKPFILEVLYDEYFNFALKRRILEKIVESFDSGKLQVLNRINTIRNYFAHCNQRLFEGTDIPTEEDEGKIVDPRRPDRAINFEKQYKEFMSIIDDLEKYLVTIYLEKGGELYTLSDSKVVEVDEATQL